MSTNLREQLETAVKGLEKFADDLDVKGEKPSGEDLENLKNRMAEIASLKEQVKTEAEVKGNLADAKSFLNSLSGGGVTEPESITLTQAGLPMQPNGKTFGEMFVESGAYADFKGRFVGRDGTIPNSVKGIQSQAFSTDAKALLTGLSSTSAGALVVNDRFTPVTDLVGERELTVYDLVTKIPTTSDAIDYARVTAKTNNAAPVAEATSSAAPTVTVDGNAQSGVALVNNAGGGYKPESSVALEVVTATVKTVAHWMPLTKRAAADAGQVRGLVDSFLSYGLREELEDQILTGSGSGENFQGINGAGVETVGSAGTDIDAIVDAIAKIRFTGRRKPTALVMHPNDWYSTGFLTAKDGVTGGYLIGDPRASIDQLNQLWGLKVVVTDAQTEGTALVGDFRQAVLWEREGISLMVSDQHADIFNRNQLAEHAEMRSAFGILDLQAFCTDTTI
jgi:HK97 family phage major capsid protein